MTTELISSSSQGAPGTPGPAGPTGPTGPAGANGKTVLNGSGAPSNGLGTNGDFYIDTTAHTIYGPKTAGVWGSPTSLIGPQGPAGTNGLSVLNGSGAPSGGTGVNGDFYIDTTANAIYGPKSGGVWGSPTSLIGPTGATGANGHGSTTSSSAPTQPASDWILHVADGTAFNNGNWVYANDGTNSIFGQILSGGSTNNLTIDHTTQVTTGTVSSIANGTVVTWRGQTGATGPTGPAGSVTSNLQARILALSPTRCYALSNAGSGTTETDLGSDGVNATYHAGGSSQARGMVIGNTNMSALFDGSSGYLNIPDNNFPTTGAFSIGIVMCELARASSLAWEIGDRDAGGVHFLNVGWTSTVFGFGNGSAGASTAFPTTAHQAGYGLVIVTWDTSFITGYYNLQSLGQSATSTSLTYTGGRGARIGASNKAVPDQFGNLAAQYWFLLKGHVITLAEQYDLLAALYGN